MSAFSLGKFRSTSPGLSKYSVYERLSCLSSMGWADFRPKYSELYILRAQLSPGTPYSGLIATLDKKALKVVESTGGFENCETLRTSFNRSEISIYLVFIEGNQTRIRRSPEWKYPPGARNWIKCFHSDMADFVKRQVTATFENPDSSEFPHLDSTVRFLAANKAFDAGA